MTTQEQINDAFAERSRNRNRITELRAELAKLESRQEALNAFIKDALETQEKP